MHIIDNSNARFEPMQLMLSTVWQETFTRENIRKLVENKIFMGKTFADCLLVLQQIM